VQVASVHPRPKLGLWLAGLGLGVLTVAVLLARALAPSRESVAVAELASAAVPIPSAESEPEREPESERLAATPTEEQKPEDPAGLFEVPADSAAPAPASSELTLAGGPSASAQPPRAASASATPAQPTQAALTTALRTTPIVMFSTDWCPVCERARAFFGANGLSYTERDIDHDERAHEELKRRTGKSSIPTIEVDGKLLTPGFSQREVMSAVAASVQRRLGVQGIEVRAP
jgi:glutaredoxin